MRQWICFIVALCCTATPGMAQDSGTGGYTDIEFQADTISGTFGDVTRLEKFTGGVKIILTSKDPSLKPLPIQAETMEFQYGSSEERPDLIIMSGNVHIQHPNATVRSGRARWDFNSGELVFSGNPVMNSERFKELKGEEMVINFKTNAFNVTKGTASEVPFSAGEGMGAPSDPSLLAESDIADWAGLIGALKTAANNDAPSPGRQLVNQLDAGVRNMLLNTETASLVEMRGEVLKQLNGALQKPGFYGRDAFADVNLNDEVQGYLQKGNLTALEQSRQNRLLFHAAFAPYMAQ